MQKRKERGEPQAEDCLLHLIEIPCRSRSEELLPTCRSLEAARCCPRGRLRTEQRGGRLIKYSLCSWQPSHLLCSLRACSAVLGQAQGASAAHPAGCSLQGAAGVPWGWSCRGPTAMLGAAGVSQQCWVLQESHSNAGCCFGTRLTWDFAAQVSGQV